MRILLRKDSSARHHAQHAVAFAVMVCKFRAQSVIVKDRSHCANQGALAASTVAASSLMSALIRARTTVFVGMEQPPFMSHTIAARLHQLVTYQTTAST